MASVVQGRRRRATLTHLTGGPTCPALAQGRINISTRSGEPGERRHTERHLDLVRDALDAHEREGDDGHDRDHAPPELLHEHEGEHEQVQRDALLEVDAVRARDWRVRDTLHARHHIEHALDPATARLAWPD